MYKLMAVVVGLASVMAERRLWSLTRWALYLELQQVLRPCIWWM